MRTLPVYLVILLVLAALGGWAWISHAPDDPRIVAAEEWPGVGPLVLWLREAYAPAEVHRVGGANPTHDPRLADRPSRHPPGRPVVEPPPELADAPPVWIPAGRVSRAQPSDSADVVALFGGIARRPLVDRRGEWAKVWNRGRESWVHLPGYDFDGSGPPWGMEAEPPRPVEPEPPAEKMLRAVTKHLGDGWTATRLGPYEARTDVADPALLAFLDRLATRVEPAWVARHGRRPLGTPEAVVLLFRRESDFRLLQGSVEGIRALHPEGFTTRGLVALYAGDKGRLDVGATLVHEMAHRIHRRALGPALPPWLEEGLADDLALSEIYGAGELDPSRLGGAVTRFATDDGHRVEVTGGQAALWTVRRALEGERLPTLAELMAADAEEFVGRFGGRLRYDLAALWVRYLVQGEDGKHRPGWHAFLDAVAAGETLAPELLHRSLGRSLDGEPAELEEDFRRWIRLRSDLYF